MMQRAKKMKYNAERRKKINKLGKFILSSLLNP